VVEAGELAQLVAQQQRGRHHQHLLDAHLQKCQRNMRRLAVYASAAAPA
jgi:hypothetical protein